MKQLILLRHSIRVDKTGQSDPSSWLATWDPPLDFSKAEEQISTMALNLDLGLETVIHTSPYNRCIQTAEILAKGRKTKLRVDQALSEWLNLDFNSHFLPPNDNGLSLLNNVNQYLSQGSCLHRDFNWDPYKLGKPGEYGEQYQNFKLRCLNFVNCLLKFYQDSNKIIVVISHGAVIAAILQIIMGKSFFEEIPLSTPIVLSKLNQNLFQLHTSGISFLHKFDNSIYKLKDLQLPLEYETNMFIDHDGDSEYSSEEDDEDHGITFKARNRSNTTGSIMQRKKSIQQSHSDMDLKSIFFNEQRQQVEQEPVPKGNSLLEISEEDEDDYWFGFNR